MVQFWMFQESKSLDVFKLINSASIVDQIKSLGIWSLTFPPYPSNTVPPLLWQNILANLASSLGLLGNFLVQTLILT